MDLILKDVYQYVYTSDDYITQLTNNEQGLSKFDKKLRSTWDTAVLKGLFRYTIEYSHQRNVPGKYSYVLHLNLKRGTERRQPEYIHSLHQPFDGNKFNFTKINPAEILFDMDFSVCTQNEDDNIKSSILKDNLNPLIINVSPLEYGHVIIAPDLHKKLPQALTLKAIEISLDTILLSSSPSLRVGFNSLCALASVNHLHVHAWYVNKSLFTENTPVKQISGILHKTTESPVPAYVFQLHGCNITDIVHAVYTVTNYLQVNNIAHNMFLTRGDVFGEELHSVPYRTIRIYIWARQSMIGIKNETGKKQPFNVAVAELGGHIPIYDANAYDTLTENDILKLISACRLDDKTYQSITNDIIKLLS